jgi:hypothetical protein
MPGFFLWDFRGRSFVGEGFESKRVNWKVKLRRWTVK